MSEFTTIKGSNSYKGSAVWERNVVHNIVSVELPTTALQTGDITWLMHVPQGAIIVDGYVRCDDLDGGTSLAYNIGDATTSNLFFANTTTGQSAAVSAMSANARFVKYSTTTRIKMTVSTTAETATAGTMIFGLSYLIDPSGEVNFTTGETPITITA